MDGHIIIAVVCLVALVFAPGWKTFGVAFGLCAAFLLAMGLLPQSQCSTAYCPQATAAFMLTYVLFFAWTIFLLLSVIKLLLLGTRRPWATWLDRLIAKLRA